jgi:hypothetical protein
MAVLRRPVQNPRRNYLHRVSWRPHMIRSSYSFLTLGVLCALALWTVAAAAQELQPYQQEALDAILATSDPETRPLMRAQLAPVLAMMGPAQVEMMLASYTASQEEAAAEAEIPDPAEDYDTVASPADLAYNRAQYEPVIRELWATQKDFDDFVTEQLAQDCGAAGRFAVWGQAWRHEVWPLDPNWPKASQSADLDVEILGGSYAQQDGRYRYDFSQVKTGFDRQAVRAAVASACAEYVAIGQAFVDDARGRIVNDMLPGGDELQGGANRRVEPVRGRLEDALQAHAPAGNGALFQALLNGERVN